MRTSLPFSFSFCLGSGYLPVGEVGDLSTVPWLGWEGRPMNRKLLRFFLNPVPTVYCLLLASSANPSLSLYLLHFADTILID